MRQLFRINRLMYAIKNLVFYAFIFALGFLCGAGIIKVHAAEDIIITKDPAFDLFKELNYTGGYGGITIGNYELKMQELVGALNDNSVHFIIQAIMNNEQFYGIRIFEFSSDHVEVTISNSGSCSSTTCLYKYNYSDFMTVLSFRPGQNQTQDKIDDSYNRLIAYINENKHLPTTTNQYTDYTIFPGWEVQTLRQGFTSNSIGNNQVFDWESNVSSTLKFSSDSRFSGLKIGENIYRENSLLPTYMNTINYGKTYYTFHDNIYVDKNKQIRFHFAVPSDKNFRFFLNHSVTYQANHVPTAPYLEYIKDGVIYQLPLDEYYSNENEIIYADTQINELPTGITRLDLVVDLNANNWYTDPFQIFFESEYPFSYEYVETEDYYTVVDWSGNYGVLLIPKVYDLSTTASTEVYSNVFYRGNRLDVKVYASTDTSADPIAIYRGGSNTEFWMSYQYLFRSNNKNQLLFFTQKNYLISSDVSLLKYDSRYFNYTICKDETSCNPIVNPNTGETITITPPKNEEDSYNLNTVVTQVKGFVRELHTTLDPITEAIQYFYNQLPMVVKSFLVTIYSSFLLFGLYKVIRS